MKIKVAKMWKFYFWLFVWSSVFLPSLFYSLMLEGVWLIVSRILGGILLVCSLLLASSGGRTLAKYAHKEAHETFWPDKFQRVGIFNCMRHPMHLGLAIFPIAVTLLSGLVLAIFSSGWGVTAAFGFVLFIEEKDTLEKYGDEYSTYMKEVPPFSIKIKCFKEAIKVWK